VSGPYSAARESNNSEIIMAGGGRTIAPEEVAKQLSDLWLDSEFEAGRSVLRVAKVDDVDTRHRGERQPARSPGS
jgi:ribose 5-phosphate isomerase RpiB